MRSATNCNTNSGQVHSWTLGLLVEAKLALDDGFPKTVLVLKRRLNDALITLLPKERS